MQSINQTAAVAYNTCSRIAQAVDIQYVQERYNQQLSWVYQWANQGLYSDSKARRKNMSVRIHTAASQLHFVTALDWVCSSFKF